MKTLTFALTATLALGAAAQGQPPRDGAPLEFPAAAVPLTAAELKERVGGKVFNVTLHGGAGGWRIDFKNSGYFFVNTTGGAAVSGPWSVEDSKVCTKLRNEPRFCNEVLRAGDALYMKRQNGEVILMAPN